MNNMRQISPARGAFCIYFTSSAYLKLELEPLHAPEIGLLQFFRSHPLLLRSIEIG
jgi:hypothetical protein